MGLACHHVANAQAAACTGQLAGSGQPSTSHGSVLARLASKPCRSSLKVPSPLKAACLAQKLERLQGSLHFLDAQAPAECRHTFFVDSPEEAAQLDPAEQLGTSQVGAA